MTKRITHRLLLVLAIGLVAIFVTQAAVRHYVELPALRQLEYTADERDVDRVRSIIAEKQRGLERDVADYSVWDATYEFMGVDPAEPRAQPFINDEIGTTAHRNKRINGMIFLDTTQNVVFTTSRNRETGAPAPEQALDLRTVDLAGVATPQHAAGSSLISSGITSSNLGYIIFAAAHILDSNEQLPSRGTLIFWRLIDTAMVKDIEQIADTPIELIPIETAMKSPMLAAALAQAQISTPGLLPRDQDANLYWALSDFTGKPAYLVRQFADAREFDEGVLPFSSVVAFASSGLVLLLLTLYFSRSFVRRLVQVTRVMDEIQKSGDYGKGLLVEGKDELAEMAEHFNALLRHIRDQEQDLRTRNDELAELSQRDALTGIHNRRFFDETFDRSWRAAARSGRSISILLIDVDYFKAFNDNYGHQSGDRVLRQVAMTLQDNLHRATDFVARYGGEEFCVILTETNPQDALHVAESLRKSIMDLGIRHEHSRCAKVVTVSIGTASINADSRIVHLDLLRQADMALYNAKGAGRNCVVQSDGTGAPARGNAG